MSIQQFTIDVPRDSDEDTFMMERSIDVYTDASLANGTRMGRAKGSGGGAFVIANDGDKDIAIEFCYRMPEVKDINLAEAKTARKTLEWVLAKFPGHAVHMYVDSSNVVDRLDDIMIKQEKFICDCTVDDYYEMTRNWGRAKSEFNRRVHKGKCTNCGVVVSRSGISLDIHEEILNIVDVIDNSNVQITFEKVKAHTNCYGNNCADALANGGRVMIGTEWMQVRAL